MTTALSPERIVYDLATASDPQIAPDGSQVLFTRAQAVRGRKLAQSQVWMCDIDGANPRALELDGERNSGARWSPDGNAIIYISNSEEGSALVYKAFNDGPARELTFHTAAIASAAWSPDGSTIAYTTEVDPENPTALKAGKEDAPRVRVVRRLDYKQDNRGFLNNTRQQIWLVDVADATRRQLTSAPIDHIGPSWSPDGTKLAVKIPNRNGMRAQLGLIDVASGETTLVGPFDGNVGCWSWSPDGSRLLIAGDETQTWQLDLFLYDIGEASLTRLTDDLAFQPDAGFPTVSPPSQPVWIDAQTAIVHGQHRGASGLYQVDVDTGAVTPVVSWQAQNTGLNADRHGQRFLQSASSNSQYGVIQLYDRASGETSTLYDPNAGISPMVESELMTIERDGFEIDIWLVKPAGFDPQQQYPVVLDIHGGPHSWYGHAPGPMGRALAAAGYLVAYSNPRGSGSYGREFTQQVIGDWGGQDYLDLMAVMDHVLTLPYADASRTGVYGHSYGGFMSAWIVGHTNRFQAAVIGAPVVDLISFFGQADIGHDFGPREIGGWPWECEEEYRFRSPLTYLEQVETPVLILHGEADDRVPIGQGEQLFATLAAMGKEVEFVRYPGGTHVSVTRTGFPAHRVDFLERLIGWFDQWLDPETPR